MDMSILSSVAMIIGLAAGLGSLLYSVYKIAKRVEMAVGVDSAGKTLAERMDRVEHQLWENGGDSLKDQVNSIEMLARETSVEVRFIRDIVVANSNLSEEPVKKAKKPSKNTQK